MLVNSPSNYILNLLATDILFSKILFSNSTCSCSSILLSPLYSLQAYKIRLAMEMPDSPINEDLGMFMACINVTGGLVCCL